MSDKEILENKEEAYRQVIESLDFNELSAKLKQKWQKDLLKTFDVASSGAWRYNGYYHMFYYLFTKKIEYTTTSFNMSRTRNVKGVRAQFNANYTYLYSTIQEGKITPEYICLDGTYISADGEFRHRFIPYRQFEYVYKKYIDIFHPFEQYLLNIANKGEISIKSVTRFAITTKFKGENKKFGEDYQTKKANKKIRKNIPKDSKAAKNPKEGSYEKKRDKINMTRKEAGNYFNKFLDQSRIPIIAYTMLFMVECRRKILGLQSSHMTPGYEPMLYDDIDLNFVKSLGSDILPKIGIITEFISTLHAEPDFDKSDKSWISLGQKIIPLKVKEIAHIEDVRYPVWREIYINKLVGNLVFNNIVFGVPYGAGYFLIHGNDKDLYDNQTNQHKLDHSFAAEEASKHLEYARRYTYTREKLDPKKIYYNYKFNELDDDITVPIDYAQRNLIMSEFAACTVSETVGRTFGDVSNIIMNEQYAITVGPIFRDVSCFSKYMFEYLYTFYCLNSKIGVIHTDPHANNVTLFGRVAYKEVADKSFKIIYEIENSHYMFEHHTKYACVIDFSRSILSNDALDRLLKDQPGKYSPDDVIDIKKKQHKIILQRYSMSLPEFYKEHGSTIEYALTKIPEHVFRLFAAYDAFHLVQALKTCMITTILNNPKKLATIADEKVIINQIFKLLDDIKSSAQEILTTRMLALCKTIDSPGDLPPYPMFDIIKENFKKFDINNQAEPRELDSKLEVVLFDFYSANKTMKWDCNDPETHPEFMGLYFAPPDKKELYLRRLWKSRMKYLSIEDPKKDIDDLSNLMHDKINFDKKYESPEEDAKLLANMKEFEFSEFENSASQPSEEENLYNYQYTSF